MDEPIVKRRPKKRRWRREWNLALFVLIMITLMIAIPYYFLREKESEYVLANYTFAEVTARTFREFVHGSGEITPRLEGMAQAVLAGQLLELRAREGDWVSKGQPLAILSSPSLEKDLGEAEDKLAEVQAEIARARVEQELSEIQTARQIRQAQAAIEKAKEELESARALLALGMAAPSEVTGAQANLAKAQEDLEYQLEQQRVNLFREAQAQQTREVRLAQAQERVAYLEELAKHLIITSPITGQVLESKVRLGQSIAAGADLFRIADTRLPVVIAQINAEDASRTDLGQTVRVSLPRRDLEGVVARISPRAVGGKVEVEIELVNPPTDLLPQTQVSIAIETRQRAGVPSLPRDQYLASGSQLFVYKIQGNEAVQQDVFFGQIDGQAIEIREGLAIGDLVILNSYDEFKDRRRIQIDPEGGRRR